MNKAVDMGRHSQTTEETNTQMCLLWEVISKCRSSEISCVYSYW